MSRPLTIRWHSRAGQGAITVANALVEILGAHGKTVQSFPEFGAEKRGAPVLVFNRIGDSEIRDTSKPRSPEIVILLDSSLVASDEVSATEVLAGLPVDGKLLINTAQENVAFASDVTHVWRLDASKIAMDEIGRDIPNVPILGALLKIAELADLESFQKELASYLSRGLPKKVVAGNMKAFERGFTEITKI